MYKNHKTFLAGMLTTLMSATGCSSTPEEAKNQSYVPGYLAALDALEGIEAEPMPSKSTIEQQFAHVFDSMGNDEELRKAVDDAYASDVYFNDTLHTFTDSAVLYRYLAHTGSQVKTLNVDILDVSISGQNIYVRWSMEVAYNDLNHGEPTVSIGVTHLRYNSAGKIALHQDYWDTANGFYRHIPVVSTMINFVNRKLHDSFKQY